jgi:hypothetical protein
MTQTGPWKTIISHRGDAFYTVAPARIEAANEGVDILIVRDSAAPDDGGEYMPGSYQSGDVAYRMEDCYFGDDEVSISAETRFAQALAMCDGLNAAAAQPQPDA